jgi:diguanylate cyclase (GGDEF)-like protein
MNQSLSKISKASSPGAAPARTDLVALVEQTVQESRTLVASHAGEIEPVRGRVATLDPQATLFRALDVMAQADELLSAQQARIQQLEGLLMQDEMTGLLNRRGLEFQFVREQSRIKRKQSRGCTLVAFDLDRFKEINDTYGHPAGDAALRIVGDFFLRTVRTTDAIARIGGDEFTLLLTDIYPDMGNRRAAGISAALNNLTLDWQGKKIEIKSSMGAARYVPDEAFDSLYQQADVALYAAKTRRRA